MDAYQLKLATMHDKAMLDSYLAVTFLVLAACKYYILGG